MNTLTQLLAAIFTLFVGLFSTQTFAQNNVINPNNISVTPVVGMNPSLFVTGTITGSITV
ncbi:MAG: hypothetical protein IPN94_16780, partial [Sphingobacteriales bacterium]|nr:hypothetical protein [Sphingobacteriales bacterium]